MFNTSFFDGPVPILLGAITGLIFGFLLQRGGVTRADTILGQFLLHDFTVLKIIFTAIVVGAVGIWAMAQLGVPEGMKMHVKDANLLANSLGGVIFGVGMAILGYCPGTGVAALGDGARDAIPGVLGMLFGAAIYAETHVWMNEHVANVGAIGKETFASVSHLSPWWFILALAILASAGFFALEKWEHRGGRDRGGEKPMGPVVPV